MSILKYREWRLLALGENQVIQGQTIGCYKDKSRNDVFG
jgi:hypothetical protein